MGEEGEFPELALAQREEEAPCVAGEFLETVAGGVHGWSRVAGRPRFRIERRRRVQAARAMCLTDGYAITLAAVLAVSGRRRPETRCGGS